MLQTTAAANAAALRMTMLQVKHLDTCYTNKAIKHESDDIDETHRLFGSVGGLEQQRAREEGSVGTPIAHALETPTREQIVRHESTHTPYTRWCKHCDQGLAMR